MVILHHKIVAPFKAAKSSNTRYIENLWLNFENRPLLQKALVKSSEFKCSFKDRATPPIKKIPPNGNNMRARSPKTIRQNSL